MGEALKVLFPGTFAPPTRGHLDLIERGSALFDHMVVGLAVDGEKASLFSVEERVALLKKMCAHLPNVEVVSFAGLTAEFAKQQGISILLRGIRSAIDLEYEKGMVLANRRLTGCETLFLLASGEHAHISSTIIRDIGKAGGDLGPFIPEAILEEVAARLSRSCDPARRRSR